MTRTSTRVRVPSLLAVESVAYSVSTFENKVKGPLFEATQVLLKIEYILNLTLNLSCDLGGVVLKR